MAKKAVNEKGKTKKETTAKDPKHEALANELSSLIPQLDSEGLEFLVEQARIHLYNMQVDKLNEAALASAAKEASTKKSKSSAETKGKSAAGTSKTVSADFTINGTESGSSFYLHYLNNDVMFSRNEMTHLVKIVNGPGTDLEIRERLYNWFNKERKDLFAVVNIKDKFDERLKALVTVIKKSFKLRDV